MNKIDFNKLGIPLGGTVPFEEGLYREERKPDIYKPNQATKSRVTRNFNESPLVRWFNSDKITQDQYGAANRYRETYYAAYPTQSSEYKARVDGGGGCGAEYSVDAEDRIIRCGQLMESEKYKALQYLVIQEAEPTEVAKRFGWGKNSVKKRVQGILDDLSYIWPATRYKSLDVA